MTVAFAHSAAAVAHEQQIAPLPAHVRPLHALLLHAPRAMRAGRHACVLIMRFGIERGRASAARVRAMVVVRKIVAVDVYAETL